MWPMNVAPPTVALLTDFGLRDAYVGIMKGVILTHCRDARLVDLTHGIEPGDLPAAAYLLSTAWPYCPPGTVFAAVVDPGVGGERRVLAADVDGCRFVAPDNGLLTGVLAGARDVRVVSVVKREFFLSPMSRTFHGRDVFAPVAAALARGIALEDFGDAVDDWLRLPWDDAEANDAGVVEGRVIYVDRFGNLVTNVIGRTMPIAPRVEIAGWHLEGLQRSYAAVPEGEALAIVGSTGRLEISVNGGSAARSLGAGVGTPVEVRGMEKPS